MQQGLARLRVHPEVPCTAVRGQRPGSIAAQAADLAEFVVACPGHPAVCRDQVVAGGADLAFHRIPAPFGADKLKLVDAGDAGVHKSG
ncbi:hypothetical protein D9M72_549680 [compost metagenome]